MFAKDPIASWLEEHFVCGDLRLLVNTDNDLESRPPPPGWFVACKDCGGQGPTYAQAPVATLDVVQLVEHTGDCDVQFLFEILQAREAA